MISFPFHTFQNKRNEEGEIEEKMTCNRRRQRAKTIYNNQIQFLWRKSLPTIFNEPYVLCNDPWEAIYRLGNQ